MTKIYNWKDGFLPEFYGKKVEVGEIVIDEDGDSIRRVEFKFSDGYIKICTILSKFLK